MQLFEYYRPPSMLEYLISKQACTTYLANRCISDIDADPNILPSEESLLRPFRQLTAYAR